MNKIKLPFLAQILTILTIILLTCATSCKKKESTKEAIADTVPVLTTTLVDISSLTTATGGGTITDDGGGDITARGVCWSTTETPTIADSITSDGTGSGTFTSAITNLAKKSVYYVRAYATNNFGTGYGNTITYRTGDSIITDIDGNAYYTITIGLQVWMMGNLKTTHYQDGSSLSNITDSVQWYSLSTGAYCYSQNDSVTLVKTYGRLYNWYAVTDSRNICPVGWHVPTDKEWIVLIAYLSGDSIAGGKMKEPGTAHWKSPNSGATNESGFLALPGGARGYLSTFLNVGYYGFFWSSTEVSTVYAYGYSLSSDNILCSRSNNYKYYGLSVRCVKD
jgi:uncharacterized protein (TIGR02145 family)